MLVGTAVGRVGRLKTELFYIRVYREKFVSSSSYLSYLAEND